MSFASGKYAKAICPVCGWRWPYNDLRERWDGQRVCPNDWEEKHPQLAPPPPEADNNNLEHPRPELTEVDEPPQLSTIVDVMFGAGEQP